MNPRRYHALISVGVLVAWAGLAGVVIGLNPAQGPAALAAFFLFFFIAVSGTAALAFFGLRRLLGKEYSAALVVSIRQGVLVGVFVTALLALKGLKALNASDIVFLVIVLAAIEVYFRATLKTKLRP